MDSNPAEAWRLRRSIPNAAALQNGGAAARRNAKMDLIRKLYVKADGFARGQTMAEYALIVSAIAVVAYAGYQLTGTTVSTLLSSVDGKL